MVKLPDARNLAFRTAVVDPPWPYERVNSTNRKMSGYVEYDQQEDRTEYQTLSIDDLAILPVGDLVSGYLFLWTPNPFLPQGFALLEAWGFKYATAIHWLKKTKNNKMAYGAGYWYRGAAETILVARKSTAPSVRTHQRNVFEAERLGHSIKPEAFQDHVESCFPGPYLELFARRVRPGWTCLGNECEGDGDDIRTSLDRLLNPVPKDEPEPEVLYVYCEVCGVDYSTEDPCGQH